MGAVAKEAVYDYSSKKSRREPLWVAYLICIMDPCNCMQVGSRYRVTFKIVAPLPHQGRRAAVEGSCPLFKFLAFPQ